jgi:hypothetical protein
MDRFGRNRDIRRTLLAVAGIGVVLFACQSRAFAADCGNLAGKSFGAATITGATSVAPPSSLLGTDPPVPVAINAAFCRVQGVIRPTADSDIRFEVWLPPTDAWNVKESFGAPSLALGPKGGEAKAFHRAAAPDCTCGQSNLISDFR